MSASSAKLGVLLMCASGGVCVPETVSIRHPSTCASVHILVIVYDMYPSLSRLGLLEELLQTCTSIVRH